MSIIKTTVDKVSAETWTEKLLNDWSDGGTAMNIIKTNNVKLFEEKLTVTNAWEWFRLILLIDVDWQLKWLEKTILHGVAIDKQWTKLDTGHQVTVFDLIDNVEGGIRDETRDVIKNLRDIYQILFLRKDVQLALDIINEFEEEKKWIQLNMILSSYVMGPLQTIKPLLHYVVLMERYDLVRGLLAAATTLHNEFDSETFLDGWMNMKDDMGRTVLHITAKQKRESWAKWFVSNYANPLERDDFNKTPFHYALKLPYVEIFWGKIQNEENNHVCLLNELIQEKYEDKETLIWLLNNGANPNEKDAFKTSYMFDGHMTILTQNGGDPSTISPDVDWTLPSIKEWILCGGGGVENYSELVIKTLAESKSSQWICMLLALHCNMEKLAFKWCNLCKQTELTIYFDTILRIRAQTDFMKKYKSCVEKVKNMCNIEYITDNIQHKNESEHL